MTPRPKIALSTVSVHLFHIEPGFRAAADLGYDGVEVMVGYHPDSRSSHRLRTLSARYNVPVLAVHAPTLVLTTPVWGVDPMVAVERSAELAVRVGAPTVVVHPPFTWQDPHGRFFDHVRHLEHRAGTIVAVENLYPWRIGRHTIQAHTPTWNVLDMPAAHITLDTSHAAAAGQDSLELAESLGSRLAHVHLADGFHLQGDQHLLPGTGTQPLSELLESLCASGWSETVSVELSAKPFRGREARDAASAAREFVHHHIQTARAAT
jgi:sugar phosphate isomerase/epimerase